MLPEISFFGVHIPTYFAWLSIVFSISIWLANMKAEANPRFLAPHLVLNSVLWIFAPAFIGARLLHVAWESPEIYLDSWSRIFMFWNGGFVYYGGFLAGCLGLFLFCKFQRETYLKLTDFFAPILAFCYGLGRMACFLAGCCHGRYCDLPWAIQGLHPVQLYSMGLEILHGGLLHWADRKYSLYKTQGLVTGLFLIGHGGIRYFTEFFRGDFRGEIVLGLSISSWISLALVVIGGALLTVKLRSAASTGTI